MQDKNHEYLRKKLWADVYRSALDSPGSNQFFLKIKAADNALKAFDERFSNKPHTTQYGVSKEEYIEVMLTNIANEIKAKIEEGQTIFVHEYEHIRNSRILTVRAKHGFIYNEDRFSGFVGSIVHNYFQANKSKLHDNNIGIQIVPSNGELDFTIHIKYDPPKDESKL